MRYLFSICLVMFFCIRSIAQEKHFIFIQTDNKQLFNVNVSGKLYSTNSSGYVIVPRLAAGDYNLVIGFAENSFPDQNFKCTIGQKDLGFQLKNLGEKGWVLFDLQSLNLTMANATATSQTMVASAPKSADEPISFNRKQDVAPVLKAADTAIASPAILTTENTATAANTNTKDIAAANSIPVADTIETPLITKLTENKTSEGINLSFSESTTARTDTIILSIPAVDNNTVVMKKDSLKPLAQDSAVAAKIALLNQRQDDVKLLEIDMNATVADSAKTVAKTEIVPPVTSVDDAKQITATAQVIAPVTDSVQMAEQVAATASQPPMTAPPSTAVKTNPGFCNNTATEEDYVKLRRRMALENTDERMIKEAKKLYKDKCFTTHQVKGLSSLFLSDEGRFRFFTASYSFVSDPASYEALQSEFIDPFYIKRFKSIVQ